MVTLPVGVEPCTDGGCSQRDGLRCAYVDRRGHACPTAWCPEHRVVVNGAVYCRRHAGVIRALPPDAASAGLPDLENRAPSLVEWVARDLDAPIHALLEHLRRPSELLTRDATHLGFSGVERRRRWQRYWKLSTETGPVHWVRIDVLEDRSDTVNVHVDGHPVISRVPPWIEARQARTLLTPERDAAARRGFTEEMVAAIQEALSPSGPATPA